ncbi:hypothetical protein AGABI2DRAFT_191136 [Agaricus bisporus var. bisporus H97]|uniref:hypothetical protein n=1 Tax=Agaricus bisporus var. bisporus (strain H97 / ATCC MYA-4626 / FGSC 10389) TaxID=936046 RepID=UPI00029F7E30|nr:hypothetical protein AGABI2DRAFT_191136 [Agaricus bisporus var. bisporus H97]EKV48982.1 hypothetical protein AGABI2DRAFT_191136 [Agaricus bisporus var. bisporus H97]
MPPAPKSPSSTTPSSKRPGAPKAKGAVRAKSGCYTCRIRRKKCDEQPNDQGFCSTCVRLRLECLGFGAKRPDWLRENQNVVQLRDKIKSFLASQGMIKGHSGSGARSSEQPPILRLTLESDSTPYHSSPSSSPPSPPPRSLPNTEYPPRRTTWSTTYESYPYPRGSVTTSEPRSMSPQSNGGYSPHLTSSSPSTVPQLPRCIQRSRRYHPYPHRQMLQPYQQPHISPAMQSNLGNSYNLNDGFFAVELESSAYTMGDGGYADDFMPAANAAGTFVIPPIVDAYHHSTAIGYLLLGYKNDVVMVEYLLCTEYIRDHIVNTIINNLPYISDPTSEQQAAALLSRVYFQRFARPGNELVLQIPDIRLQLHEVENALNRNGGEGGSAEDAMAALHLVSVVLFDGGCGAWIHYLDIAARYVRGKMRGTTNMGGLAALRKLSEKEAFISCKCDEDIEFG